MVQPHTGIRIFKSVAQSRPKLGFKGQIFTTGPLFVKILNFYMFINFIGSEFTLTNLNQYILTVIKTPIGALQLESLPELRAAHRKLIYQSI